MATTFQQSQTASYNGFTAYLWSQAANWTAGVVPVNGGSVVFNEGTTTNPDGVDDIGSLYLDKLAMTQGYLSVNGVLEIGTLAFGSGETQVYADTLLGNASALLTIDGLSGSGAVEAAGSGAVTNVLAPTDPGETYLALDGGEVELTAAPNSSSQLEFYNGPGTFALRTVSATIATPLEFVAIGDAIALPGSSVSSVTFGASSLTLVTNLGTTTFNDVNYQGTKPTGYTVSTDPTGLERVTFTSGGATTFQQSQTGSYNGFTAYLWSQAANWTAGVPVNGGSVVFNEGTTTNPDGVDDIGSLYLDKLTMTQGYLSVNGVLEIGTLAFGSGETQVYADTLLGNASALLTIDGLSGSGAVEAAGSGAVTNVRAPTDPGETYLALDGGEVELTAAPNSSSQLEFYNGPGTFALRTVSATIATPLEFVAIGDAIALPGSSVSSVTFGASSLTLVTNLGTTTFNDVNYQGTKPTGYTVSTDPTGLERVTLACYARGTRIATPEGEIEIERLTVGQSVLTAKGEARPIRWIGWRTLDLRRFGDDASVLPIRIVAGAFGDGSPHRDLWISPGHNLAREGHLIPACALVYGLSVAQMTIDAIEYWHVELDTHDVILAEGVAAETYLDTGNRSSFANASVVGLRPDFGVKAWNDTCLPLATQGPPVVQARAHLLAHLAEQGDRVDHEADGHLLVDGRRIEPIFSSRTRLAFALSCNGRSIALRSQIFIPLHTIADNADTRALGLCVGRLQIDGEETALADTCGAGWHAAEFSDGRFTHRWTEGATPLPSGARIVIVDLAGEGRYRRCQPPVRPSRILRRQLTIQ